MTPHFAFDLDRFPADPLLLDRIPYTLAAYYEVLPVAQEGNRITVVTPHPDNSAALDVLGRLLGAEIVAVHSSDESVRAAIEHYHHLAEAERLAMSSSAALAPIPPEAAQPSRRFLAWSAHPAFAADVSAVTARFGQILNTPFTDLAALALQLGPTDVSIKLDDILHLARTGSYHLLVLHTPTDELRLQALSQSPTPLLLVRGADRPIHNILMVMRGYASDEEMLAWVLPFVRNGASLTMMPLTAGSSRQLPDLLNYNGAARQHIDRCRRTLEAEGIRGYLKFRQGEVVTQIADELSAEATAQATHSPPYDLLLLAAEGQGEWVASVCQEIERRRVHEGRPIFVLKPLNPLPPA